MLSSRHYHEVSRQSRENTGTTIDLVWAAGDIRQRMRQCSTRPDLEADSNYLPTEMTIRVETQQTPQETRRKYKDMDITKFRK